MPFCCQSWLYNLHRAIFPSFTICHQFLLQTYLSLTHFLLFMLNFISWHYSCKWRRKKSTDTALFTRLWHHWNYRKKKYTFLQFSVKYYLVSWKLSQGCDNVLRKLTTHNKTLLTQLIDGDLKSFFSFAKLNVLKSFFLYFFNLPLKKAYKWPNCSQMADNKKSCSVKNVD